MFRRADVWFGSGGERCAAWLYLPTVATGTSPCVVMAHGTTGTRDLGLAAYAERFAGAGCAVVVFDYRHFGASEGMPRQLVSIRHQLEDWRAAIRFARTVPEVDPDRIAIWGTSLGGGHVVTVAAADSTIAAAVAQLPWMGIDRRADSPRSARVTRKLFSAALWDAVRGMLGRPPVMLRMVAAPGDIAVFTGAEDHAAMRALAAGAPEWRNEMAGRSMLSLLRYRPGAAAGRVVVPLLICVADDDTAASVPLAVRAANEAPHAELRRYPGSHFAAYTGDVFEQMVRDQTAFLQRHLAIKSLSTE